MNVERDRCLNHARVYDLARQRAQALRSEAMARFWSQLGTALASAAGGASRSARRLWVRLTRRANARLAGSGAQD